MCPTCQAFPFPFTFPHLLSLHPLSSLHLVFIAISTPCISYASTFLLLSPTPSTLSSVFPIVSFLGPCPPPFLFFSLISLPGCNSAHPLLSLLSHLPCCVYPHITTPLSMEPCVYFSPPLKTFFFNSSSKKVPAAQIIPF